MESYKNIKLLRLVLNITETSGAYHLFSIPASKICKQEILSYFEPGMVTKPELIIHHAYGSFKKYFKKLKMLILSHRFNVVHEDHRMNV